MDPETSEDWTQNRLCTIYCAYVKVLPELPQPVTLDPQALYKY